MHIYYVNFKYKYQTSKQPAWPGIAGLIVLYATGIIMAIIVRNTNITFEYHYDSPFKDGISLLILMIIITFIALTIWAKKKWKEDRERPTEEEVIAQIIDDIITGKRK
jgi:putative copper export protein